MYRMFVRPEGRQGEIGADLMERNGPQMVREAVGRLNPGPGDSVLEIGFGPGLGLEALAIAVPQGHVTGVDPSRLMHRRAARRNAAAIDQGRMTLVEGTVDTLPFARATFDAALAIDNLHFWPDRLAGLLELQRVLRPNAPFLCAFTPPSGGTKTGLTGLFSRAGFDNVVLAESPLGVIAMGYTPA